MSKGASQQACSGGIDLPRSNRNPDMNEDADVCATPGAGRSERAVKSTPSRGKKGDGQTRERLLQAARTIFAERGYAAASIERIAASAGYTRGAFYSSFRDKTVVLLELLKRDHEAVERELVRIVEAGNDREATERAMHAYFRQRYRQPDACVMWMEAALLSVHDRLFRARFTAFLNERRERAAERASALAERADVRLPLPVELLMLGLTGLGDDVLPDGASGRWHLTDAWVDAAVTRVFALSPCGEPTG
ncbi:TetR/AcrR family transcriptional regulator [Burkholderia metallica]|uniref:TetR/AcrR family transcriptional regulator n=1 Tax=Burkholderia metallica TaxID=488729 RepID=A0ABT8PFB0_9BURK|nr:TetR/AcrR family transcriptional regulator [Burkholderia metallica]MDN7933168.1 TetR/AcrR family transcriptional regulator [Burkholderia metallica]